MNKVSTHGRSATIGRRCQMSEDPGTPLAGEDPSALETAEELAEIAAESITGWYYARGTRHLHKRRYAKAVAALRKCTAVSNVANEVGITVTVPLSLALYKLGLALEKLPDLPKATEALEKAIAADPGRMPAREALARVAISRQDYNRAINEYYDAYAFIEEHQEAHTPIQARKMECEILTRLGALLMNVGKQREAGAVLGKAVSIYPENTRTLTYCAIVADAQGNEIELIRYLGLAFERYKPDQDGELINILLQEAANARYGIAILNMLDAHNLIAKDIIMQRKRTWQHNWEQMHAAADQFHVSTNGGPLVTRIAGNISNLINNGNANNIGENNSHFGDSRQVYHASPKLNVDFDALLLTSVGSTSSSADKLLSTRSILIVSVRSRKSNMRGRPQRVGTQASGLHIDR